MTTRPRSRPAAPPPAVELPPVTLSEMGGIRYLHLGTPWVQGAMRLSRPLRIELDYVRRMMVWMLLRPEADDPSLGAWQGLDAVQLGLGAGAITRFCHQALGARTTAVEVNPDVIEAAHAWFHLPRQDPRLQVIERDASEHVADPACQASADVLCVDLYDHEAASPVLDSELFYRGCHDLLRPGGVMTVNLFGRDASFERSCARMAQAFGEPQLFSLQATKEGNTVVGGVKELTWPSSDTLVARAKNIETGFQLPGPKWLKMIRR
ncbi:MAG: methyltransferase domain-containing protein [Pseudomonadota bacterium]